MGIGHYTETAGLESARAGTGWPLREPRTFEGRRMFAFKPQLHDGETKSSRRQAGDLDGTDIMRIILANPATPRWIGGRLARFFVGPTPAPALVEAMAQRLVASGYEIAPVLRSLFRSRAFYGPDVM